MVDSILQEAPLYIEDTKLVSLVRENGSVAIGNNGHIYTSKSPFDSTLLPILSELKQSETAFDGQFFGITPNVTKVKQELINNHLQLLLSIRSQEASDITQSDAAEAVIRLHQEALDRGASDIHIQLRDDETLISFRIDGDLEFIRTQPIAYGIEFASYAGRTLGELTNYSVSADKADSRYDLTLEVEDEDNKKFYRENILAFLSNTNDTSSKDCNS